MTRTLARILGPFHFIIPIVAILRDRLPSDARLPFPLEDYDVWPWESGATLLLLGIIVIALHQHYNSIAAVLVSGFGWFLTIRGLLEMTWPRVFMTLFHVHLLWLVVYILIALAGLYLTWVGWKPPRRSPAPGTRQTRRRRTPDPQSGAHCE